MESESRLTTVPGSVKVDDGSVNRFSVTPDRISESLILGFKTICLHESGGLVWKHKKLNSTSSDYHAVEEIAHDKASAGSEVFMLPTLHPGDSLRELIFPGAKERKCPDLLVDGQYLEVKTPMERYHERKISNTIRQAYSQANWVVIRLVQSFDIPRLEGIAKGRFITHPDLEIIEFKVCGVYYTYKRGDII